MIARVLGESASALTLHPPPRHKLGTSVVRQLLDVIRLNRLKPGTRMPSERELMAALGVGRSTIREALSGLALLGVIEIRHGRGAFVAEPLAAQPDAIASALAKGVTRDLLEARRSLEISIAEYAAKRRTAADLHEIEAILHAQARAVAVRESAAVPSAQFHVALAEASHNEVLAGFISSIADLLVERGPLLEQQPSYLEWELGEHRGIFEAVRDGNAKLAAKRMRKHLSAMTQHHARAGNGSAPEPHRQPHRRRAEIGGTR